MHQSSKGAHGATAGSRSRYRTGCTACGALQVLKHVDDVHILPTQPRVRVAMLVVVEVYCNVMAAQGCSCTRPRRTCTPRRLALVSVLLGSARQAGSERLSSSRRRDACRSDVSSSRLLPAILEHVLASCGTASLDAIIDREAPSVSQRTLRHNRPGRSHL
jgi:hypothetical protein